MSCEIIKQNFNIFFKRLDCSEKLFNRRFRKCSETFENDELQAGSEQRIITTQNLQQM